MTEDLAERVRRASPAAFLPSRTSADRAPLVPPHRLVAALELTRGGGGPWATVVADAEGTLIGAPLVSSADAVRRGGAGLGASEALLGLLDPAAPGPTGPGFELVALHPGRAEGERAVGVDQTHDSVVVGEHAVVKWAVHLEAGEGPVPAVRAARHLDAVGFDETPEPLGFLLWRDGRTTALVASATTFLPGAEDGWDWAVDDLLEHLSGRLSSTDAVLPAALVGDLTARLHLALATPSPVVTSPVSTATAVETERWRDQALALLDQALVLTGGDPGARLSARADDARAALATLGSIGPTAVSLVHGDLHVGQVLRWDGGYAVTDFDGNPVLGMSERVAPQPPARDVAGMLRSLDHVGRIADRRTAGAHSAAVAAWTASVRAAFLDHYLAVLAAAGRGDLFDERLLLPFEVEQECREFVYAAQHLHRWVYVPDAAFADLMGT